MYQSIILSLYKADVFLELPKCSSKMAELIKTNKKINKTSPKFHKCSPLRYYKTKGAKTLYCRKCQRAVHYKCSRIPSYQIQLCLPFKERRYQSPNCIKVLEELEVSKRDTIKNNNNTKKWKQSEQQKCWQQQQQQQQQQQ